MKKYYVAALIGCLAINGYARQLSPEEAIARLQTGNMPAKATSRFSHSMKPALTMRNGTFTSLYVFDSPNGSNDGFMIVSADDSAVPLLGYSDTGRFDPDSIPPQLQGWLDFYAREIQAASASKDIYASTATSQTRPERDPILPLTKSKWNQGAPYNDDCPLDNGKRSVTGCVATAMAQVMYYHQWPTTGKGSSSYHWSVGDTTLSLNYADITFDWTDMTETYGKESTTAQKAAVAELMYACGVSVHMHYTSGESGSAPADIGHSLASYFDYASNMAYPQRYFYGLIDWENMVYDQLSQGLPVLYNGQGSIGGHSFICDGYSTDGYFHFNWGWSGMSDGYFLLSALDPMEQGIGGNLTGFDYEQGIWINVKPKSSGEEPVTPYIYAYGNFGTTAQGSVELGKEITFDTSKDFMNFTNSTLKGQLGIAIESNGTTQYVAHDGTVSLGFYSATHSFTVTLPADLAAGTYTVTPAFKSADTGEWTPILCSLSGVQALTMTVADGKASFVSSEPASVEVTSVTKNTPFYFGTKFSVTVDFTNPGTEEYYGELMLALVDADGKRIDNALMSEALNLPGGQSTTVDIVSDFPRVMNKKDTVAPGDYYLQIYEYMTNNVLYTSSATYSISEPPKTTLAIESLEVAGQAEGTSGKVDVNFSGVAKCTEGYFAGQLQVRVYKKGATETSAKAKSDYIFADLNAETPFTATIVLPDAKDGEEYYAEMWNDNAQIGTDRYTFTINTHLAGIIDEATTDSEGDIVIRAGRGGIEIESVQPLEYAALYTIDGMAVKVLRGESQIDTSALAPGIYIVKATDSVGHTVTKKFPL